MKGSERKQLRAIGHHLSPVLMIAGSGLSDSVLAEAERALHDHELIKIRISIADRSERQLLAARLARQLGAELIQTLGHTALLFRANPKPDPRLSNRLRSRQES